MPRTLSATLCAVILMAAVAMPGRAQAFADQKTALVDYSKAEVEPRKACEALGKFKSKEIAQITATMMPADRRLRRPTAASRACFRPRSRSR